MKPCPCCRMSVSWSFLAAVFASSFAVQLVIRMALHAGLGRFFDMWSVLACLGTVGVASMMLRASMRLDAQALKHLQQAIDLNMRRPRGDA